MIKTQLNHITKIIKLSLSSSEVAELLKEPYNGHDLNEVVPVAEVDAHCFYCGDLTTAEIQIRWDLGGERTRRNIFVRYWCDTCRVLCEHFDPELATVLTQGQLGSSDPC